MARPEPLPFRNTLLAGLAADDLELIRPSLVSLTLPLRRTLQKPGTSIADIFFLEEGIASVVAVSARPAKRVEAGIIGREGVTGIEVILADDRSLHDVYMQVAGTGHRIATADLVEAMMKSAALQRTLLRFAGGFLMQVTETALANGSATIEARLSRWLLMAQDRLDEATLPLTHEFLALMLSVRRPGVTIAIQALTRAGVIEHKRGRVVILDRKGLIERAGGIYGRAHAEQKRLAGG